MLFSILLLASYLAASTLPVSVGWENGVVENAQTALLFLGGAWAVWACTKATESRSGLFWLMISPIWFIMAVRELSWGAVFYTPLAFSEQLGPTFSSSQQLWYKPVVAPFILAILIACVAIFLMSRQHRTIINLANERQLPLTETLFFCLLMVGSAAAEGHMGMHTALSEGADQVFEETLELWAYLALLLAQCRVMQGLGQVPSGNVK